MCCVALPCYLFDLAFFLPSHLSLKHVRMLIHAHLHLYCHSSDSLQYQLWYESLKPAFTIHTYIHTYICIIYIIYRLIYTYRIYATANNTIMCYVCVSYPLHSPEQLELLPGVGVGHELTDASSNTLLHAGTQLVHLWVQADITEVSELHWLVLSGDSLRCGLNTRTSQPTRKFIGAGTGSKKPNK